MKRKAKKYTEIEKDKSPEAKVNQNNLRKASMEQTKLRPGILN